MVEYKKDCRGLKTYLEMSDSYGSKIEVKDSSSAEEVACWVMCKDVAGRDFAPHLTVEEAKVLIAGLEAFVLSVEGEGVVEGVDGMEGVGEGMDRALEDIGAMREVMVGDPLEGEERLIGLLEKVDETGKALKAACESARMDRAVCVELLKRVADPCFVLGRVRSFEEMQSGVDDGLGDLRWVRGIVEKFLVEHLGEKMPGDYEKARALLLATGVLHSVKLCTFLGVSEEEADRILGELVQEGVGVDRMALYHYSELRPDENGHPFLFMDPGVSEYVVGSRCPVCGDEFSVTGEKDQMYMRLVMTVEALEELEVGVVLEEQFKN